MKVGIILGSGLNKFINDLSNPKILYSDKKGFHMIRVLSGSIQNKDVVIFSGRKHFYEGYPADEIFRSVTASLQLGVKLLIITNAAGGLNPAFGVSDLMLIHSHFNFYNKRIPVKGGKELFNKAILEKIKNMASQEKLRVRTGNYCCTYGPMYETRSEIRMLNKFSIDAVGMSTVPEIIYAADKNIPTIGISCITNLLKENSNVLTNHDEVIIAGKKSYGSFSKLLKLIIANSEKLTG